MIPATKSEAAVTRAIEPTLAAARSTLGVEVAFVDESADGVPVRLSDGSVCGSLCCVEDPLVAPGEREVALQLLARLVGQALERETAAAELARRRAQADSVQALLAALTARDDYTGEHSTSVVELAVACARRLGLSDAEVVEVEHVALLHDVGKVGIPDSILGKPGPLDAGEWRVMRRHPAIGARVVDSVASLRHLAPAIRAEHERFDGAGYPDGLAGDEIPLASRIVLACDAYHAMRSDRPYRRRMPQSTALRELAGNAGTQFDPQVVAALIAVLDASGRGARQIHPRSADMSTACARSGTPSVV